jgi:hypothetical protein
MGCASSAFIYVTNGTQSTHLLVENNSCSLAAPVLQRPRNFQWCWSSIKDQEQWQNYTDIENEILEDAYNEKMTREVEIDGKYLIDFEHLLQYKKNDLHKQFRIKRVQLAENRTNLLLREERFTTLVMLTITSMRSISQHDPLPKQYWKLELENKIKTMADLVEDAALGIMKQGTVLGKVHEARWLANQLLTVKHCGSNVRAQYSRVPKEIGETCVYLYTKQSFWYKLINDFLLTPETVTIEQLKTYAPFCHLMHWFLKKNYTTDSVNTVYRSLDLNDEQRLDFTKTNITFISFTSTTKSREKAECFGNTLLIIYLNVEYQLGKAEEDAICGADISILSDLPDEEEFLIWPGSDVRFVKEEYDTAMDKYVIYLQSLQNYFI